MRGLNVRVIVLTCLVSLGVVLTGNYFIYRYKVTDPLLERIAQLTGVENVAFETIGNQRHIVLTLSATADLPDIHSTVSQLGVQALGKRFGGVIIRDNRSSELAESYYQMHFHIQEGIATGLFTQMATGLEQIAEQEQLDDYRVYITEEYIYLQLSKAEHSLFELIPRSPDAPQAAPLVGGYAL